jgi:hypothetical protein
MLTIHHRRRHAVALAVISALWPVGVGPGAYADELIFGIIPEAEWSDGRVSTGAITPNALKAVEVATSELREQGRKVESFQSIYVSETKVSFLVQFSDLELHSMINDDRTAPADGRLAIFRIDKRTFEILGSVY